MQYKSTTWRIDPEMIETIRELAFKERISQSELVRMLLKSGLRSMQKPIRGRKQVMP